MTAATATILESDDSILEGTQAIRLKMVEQLTPEGKMPNDPKEQMILLQALDSMDRQALGKKRLKVDEKHNDAMAKAAAVVADVYGRIGNGDPYAIADRVGGPPRKSTDPLTTDITVVPGELDFGVKLASLEEIQKDEE